MLLNIAWFSGLPGSVALWSLAGFLFWVLSRFPAQDSLEFVLLDALTLISALVAVFSVPFAILAGHLAPVQKSFMDEPLLLFFGAVSLLLTTDSFYRMRRFFLD
ncbi:hypothetical protein AB4090_04720 [Acidithiobacillus sp. IBUN Pt1247-S3]|uniref:hypothetical protein n=1 Tax=Acidithiobacillus sp. IBUN Pt1247-S3 TaxID=3166642 RepID=UPI0034E448BF